MKIATKTASAVISICFLISLIGVAVPTAGGDTSSGTADVGNVAPLVENLSPSGGVKAIEKLSADISDNNNDSVDVTFYDNSNDTSIGTDTVSGSGTAKTTWTGLSKGTSHSWYVEANDSTTTTTSSVVSFNTYPALGYAPLYFRDNLPAMEYGWGLQKDTGTLLLNPPTDNENKTCERWVEFNYGAENDYAPLENVYFHFWWTTDQLTTSENYWSGWYDDSDHDYWTKVAEETMITNGSIVSHGLNNDSPITHVSENFSWMTSGQKARGWRLSTFQWDTGSHDPVDFFDETFGFETEQETYTGDDPGILSSPEFQSFAILNVPDNSTLQGMDSDSDSLTDYQELYGTYTNPFQADTDSDGTADPNENFPNDPTNHSPTASFTTTVTDKTVDVDASASYDNDGSISTYAWDWTNDSTYEVTGSTSATDSHTYSSGGDYTIKLRVTDDDGATDTLTKTVSANWDPAIISTSISTASVDPETSFTIDVRVQDNDSLSDLRNSTNTSVLLEIYENTVTQGTDPASKENYYKVEFYRGDKHYNVLPDNTNTQGSAYFDESASAYPSNFSVTEDNFKYSVLLNGTADYANDWIVRVKAVDGSGVTATKTIDPAFSVQSYMTYTLGVNSVEWTSTSLDVPSTDNPCDNNGDNPMLTQIETNHSFNVEAKLGSDWSDGGGSTFAVSNTSMDNDSTVSGATNMSTTYQTVQSGISQGEGLTENIYYWLDIPNGTPAGTYTTTFNMEAK